MERRVQFEAGVDRAGRSNTGNPPKGQPASRTDQRKPTLEKQAQPGKPRPAIGFEDYLKKKPSRGEKKPDFEKGPPLKPPVPRQRARTEKPQQTRPVDKPSSLKKPSHIAEPLQDVAVEPREKEELSLENIFDSRLAKEDNPRAADHFVAHEGDTEDVLSPLANRSAVDKRQLIIEHASGYHSHTAMAPQRMATVGASPERSPGVKLAGDEAQQGKAIRGLFKKEVYGDDESKRKEAQLRMKKELEMQMEEKKLKKQQDKLRIEEEERLENEKYNKFLEKEKIKKDEEERKEQENKRKKEMFTIQQAALLEEFKQTSNADRRSKAGKKLSITDVTSTQAGNNNTNGNTSNTVLNKGAVGASDRMSIQSNFNTNNTVYGQQPSTTNGYLASLEAHEIRTDSNFGGGSVP
jgi:hypothetical protein